MEDFKNKNVLVMGLGLHQGGVGVVKFLAEQGARITVTDLRGKKELAPSLRLLSGLKSVKYVLGRHRKKDFLAAELVVKNPGVRPDSSFLKIVRERDVPVMSDIGIFFKNCPANIIGVTGTRGKSTVANLIYQILRLKKRVFLAGNIRKSALEILPKLQKNDWIVLELSSFQLHDLAEEWKRINRVQRRSGPQIAVITNLMRDHLNWHPNLQAYWQAKANIFRFQKRDNYLFFPARDRKIAAFARSASSKIIKTKLPAGFEKIVDEKFGKHYRESIGLAVAVAKHFGVSSAAIRRQLGKFKGLEGRQQELKPVNGIHFVNDTTATTPEAAIAAIERFSKKAGEKKLMLIAGGSDKGLDFHELVRAIREKVDTLMLLPGRATQKLKKNIRPSQGLILARDMREAVRRAYQKAQKGDWVLLSPGAASFGLFLNEFDRGEQFIEAVRKIRTS